MATISPDSVGAILDALEAIFRELLGLHFNNPLMVSCLCRLLEACERLIALRKDFAVPAIEKVCPALGLESLHVAAANVST